MRKFFLIFVIFILIPIFFTTTVLAAVSWTETQPAGNTDNPWTPVAMSSDGQIIIVGSQNGGLYLSENGGDTWAETQPDGDLDWNWLPVSMSSNGQIILAGVLNNRLYITTNGGDIWTETRPGGDNDLAWYTSSMSSNGQIILAGVHNSSNGRLYRSTNAGSNWTEVRPVGNTNQLWMSTTMSSDGQRMFAGIDGSRLYRSTNGGDNWTEMQPAGAEDLQWSALGISANGQTVLAGSRNRLYRSTNGGDNWTEMQPAGDNDLTWQFASVSSDGATMFVSEQTRLYFSNDGGDSWSETRPLGDINKTWNGGAISSDSQVLIAVVYDGRVFLGSNPYPPTPPVTPVAELNQAPICNASPPTQIPNLFRIDSAGTHANLYFTTNPEATAYSISYGITSEANQYGDLVGFNKRDWILGRTISHLKPNTIYYFKVRGLNDCSGGSWSKTVKVKTKSQFANISQFFANLNPFSSNPTLITSKSSGKAVAGGSKSPGSCSYVVQEGDSFWRIAERELGRGSRFGELVSLNPGVSILQIGQAISVCK